MGVQEGAEAAMLGDSRDEAVPQAPTIAPETSTRRAWGKISAIVLIGLLIVAGLALLARKENRSPTISRVTVGSTPAAVGELVNFTAQATDLDSDSLTYSWDFGDGITLAGDSVKHAYGLPGNFIALVTVTDGKGGEVTNDGNLLFVQVSPRPIDLSVPICSSATCKPGPVVAVLSADRSTAQTGKAIRFNANSSRAYAFSWNDSTNHSRGGAYAPVSAADNTSLFGWIRYSWGDGTDNATGTSEGVGEIFHTFTTPGNYFVRLTVLYVNADLNPSTKPGYAGYTERITAPSGQSGAPGVPGAMIADSLAVVSPLAHARVHEADSTTAFVAISFARVSDD